ncbi:hypothetical protein KIPB_001508, partial [Kipferlia bialata]|eukprot:g1508.t1
MADYSACLGHRYHVDLIPGAILTGPPVDVSEEGCSIEGTVGQLSDTYLHLQNATCTHMVQGKAMRYVSYIRLQGADLPRQLVTHGNPPYISKYSPGKESIVKRMAAPYALVAPCRMLQLERQTLLFDCAVSNRGSLPLFLLAKLSSDVQTSIAAKFTPRGSFICLKSARDEVQPLAMQSADPVSVEWMHRVMDTLASIFSAWS